MKREGSHYHMIAAVSALVLTAIAISASIIYAIRNPREDIYINERKPSPTIAGADDGFDRMGEYVTPYGAFTPIEHILDVNEYMTKKPVILTKEETKAYISPSGGDCEEIMARVKEISDEICKGLDDDSDKAYNIAMWVGTNLIYDHDAEAERSDLSVISLEAIFKNNYRTTCGGFANMYAALCSVQGIYCLNMKGGAASGGYTRAQLAEAPANHEWNAVNINGKWYFSDPTWISDLGSENGELTGGEDIKDFYAMFGFGQMSVEHRIDRCEYRNFN